jgi:CBS domain-containing protein
VAWAHNDHPEVTIVVAARELMTAGAQSVAATSTLVDAARQMRDLGVGSLPICGLDDKLEGVLTDRDIVVHCVADGGDPASTKASELARGTPVTIGADDAAENALLLMAQHQIRRLPVIDDDRLVGMISQADVARALPEKSVGAAVRGISED